ncbi:hypothetical protein ONS95_014414 [Cadophora gregata]|uniref:uncharacterized protein n=1 Tax=Cadophora gregata TaxID=51156 RepID=UPI0026DAB479|nr:uncharacterized protein ONS95_014414 [Cadophora gregata]KAK0112675.1 hypothetical protein ONS95_014414 [Cadophora gregata]KAK0124809.1 hypothetical protein ONS96_008690 [Cadophora gregata f. sp. sojae]
MWSQYFAVFASWGATMAVGQIEFDNGLLNGTSCVAQEQFEQCRLDILNDSSCLDNLERGNPCVCQKRAEMLNCFGSYCWNFIYGCEYQETIRQFMLDCYPDPVSKLESVPFRPAPPEGPGVCSCNLESMEQDLTDVSSQYDTCIDIRKSDSNTQEWDCYCCSTSRTLSIPIDVCQKSDITEIHLNASDVSTEFGELWLNCAPVLERVDCKKIGYKALPSATLYQPSNLPLPGTEPLSNLPGQMLTPVSGWTYSWTLGTKEYVVSAFSPSGTVISTPTASVPGGASSGPISSTGSAGIGPTSTGSAAPSTTSTSSGSFRHTRPLRSHDEQIMVIIISLLLIALLVMAGMYF